MHPIYKLLLASAVLNSAHLVKAADVTLTFDDNQTDFGAYELTGVDTELTLSRSGGFIANNDFTEITGLSTETYTVSGAPLGTADPFTVTITASGGTADVVSGGIDVNGGGIDSGESLTFSFNRTITLTQLDFANIADTEVAEVTIAGVTTTYGSNHSGTGDVVNLNTVLTAGSDLVFTFATTNGSDYDLQGITFTVVPEPQSFALLAGAFVFGLILCRHRRRL